MVTAARMKRLGRRALRWLGRGLVAVLLLVLLLALTIVLRPGRELWLDMGVRLAQNSLPGQLQARWSWPSLGRLEAHDLVWTDAGPGGAADTLAVVAALAVEVDLGALRQRELDVREASLDGSLIDVPRILLRFPRSETAAAAAAGDSAAGWPYFRPGAMPGLPSAGARRIEFACRRLVLPAETEVADLRVRARASARAGETPAVELEHASGRAGSAASPLRTLDLAEFTARASYDPAAGTVAVDTVTVSVPSAFVVSDTLEVLCGPLTFAGAGAGNIGGWRGRGGLELAAEVPPSLRSPVRGVSVARLAGRCDLDVEADADRARLDVALVLDPTDGDARGELRGMAAVALDSVPRLLSARVDTLALRWRTMQASARGRWDAGGVDARFNVGLEDLDLPSRLLPAFPAGLTGSLAAEGSVAGPVTDPEFAARLDAHGDVASVWRLPGAAAWADSVLPPTFPRDEFAPAGLDLGLELSGSLDSLLVVADADLGRSPWLDRGRLRGEATVHPRRRALRTARIDSLAVTLLGASLDVRGEADTSSAALDVDLRLEGTRWLDPFAPDALPGAELDLAAEARLEGPLTDLGAAGRLSGSFASADAVVPGFRAGFSASRERMTLAARAGEGVRVGQAALDSLAVTWDGVPATAGQAPSGRVGLRLWAPTFDARVAAHTTGDSLRVVTVDTLAFAAAGQDIRNAGPTRVTVGPGPRDVSVAGLRLRGDLGRLDFSADVTADRVRAAADVDLAPGREWLEAVLPSPLWSAGGGIDASLRGQIDLDTGAPDELSAPPAGGRLELRLVPQAGEPVVRLDAGFRLVRGDSAGLLADLDLGMDQAELLNGSVNWPGAFDPATGRWVSGSGSGAGLRVPRQTVPLALFNRFLPGEVALDGGLEVGAGVALVLADSLDGEARSTGTVDALVRAEGLRIQLPRRSRIELDGEITAAGRLADPRPTGTITIKSGLFHLPEVQHGLHPTTGTSELWSALKVSEGDTLRPWRAGEAPPDPAPPYVPDLDLRIVMPGDFKVVGYGLDTELAGELQLRRGHDAKGRPAPVLYGQVRVLEGTLRALNHVFEVERGELNLEGRIPADPTVDLVLATTIDGTVVRIRVTGTAMQPKVTLESEPEMIQADIMAFLLFGRPLNDLDVDQRGSLREQESPAQQLRQNLQGLALVFGAAGLQNTVTSRLGVDRVQIGTDAAGGSTLVLGKFLNPRTLLKYHQSLERTGTYFMTLEYELNRPFKLISTYGQGDEASGVELRWQRRY